MAGTRKDNRGRVLKSGEQQRTEDGLYLYRYTDLLGRRKTVYASTLQELRVMEREITRDLEDGIDTAKGDMTLNQLFKLYLDTKADIRDTTRKNYNVVWKNDIENTRLGNMKISEIKHLHVCALYGDLAKRELAESTIKLCHTLISSALDLAVDSDFIRKNPAKGCQKNITGEKAERTALTRIEQTALIDFTEDSIYSNYRPMLVFELSTGLRVGELTGLRWSDIDMKKSIVHIRRQLIYKNLGDGCKFHVWKLKTDAGRRDIPLTKEARKALLRQKELDMMLGVERQEVEKVKDFVFVNSKGKPYAPNSINSMLKNLVDARNRKETQQAEKEKREPEPLPHISAHILRHTACTRMAESGLEPKVLQFIMGHSTISITMDVYTHLDFSEIQKKLENVEENILIG